MPSSFNSSKNILFNSYSLDADNLNFKDYSFYSFLDKRNTDFKNIDKASSDFVLDYISKNVSQFNAKFKLNEGHVFYRIALYPWLITIVQSYIERYLQLKTFQKKFKEDISVELINNNQRIQFEKVEDIHDALNTIGFNEWLTSIVIRNTPNNFIKIESEKNFTPPQTRQKRTIIRDILVGIIRNKYLRVHKIYGFNIFDQFFFSFLLFFKKDNGSKENELAKPNTNKKNIFFDFSFIPIDTLFELTMPNSIKNIQELVQNQRRVFKRNKLLLGSQHIRSDDKYRIGIALAAEAGEKIIGCQHGGDDYGLSEYCEEINVNEFNHHKFITWGWEKHSEYKQSFTRLPSPYLTKFMDKHKKTTDQIIFISTRMNQVNRFLSARPTQYEWYEHLQNQVELLSKMKKNGMKIAYRPHPKTDGAIPAEKYLKSKIINLDIHRGDLHKSLLKASSVIIDHPGTTLNISMAANIPTILFWKKDFFPLEGNAKMLFEEFESKSIFFDDHEKLLKHISETNIQNWWAGDEVQKLRQQFNKSYSFTKLNWRKDWIDFFYND